MALLTEIEAQLAGSARRPGDAVVGLGRGWGVGSGVVIAAGRVLTSAHNLRHDETTVTFGDGSQETGRVAGADPDLDIAVIEVDTGSIAPVDWPAEVAAPQIGRPVVALGNPGGRGLRVTLGFVSCAARSFRGPRGRRIAGAIEHTAPLPRGSSGGPLVDLDGALLGVNSLRVEGGLILAVPADPTLRGRLEPLARGEAVGRPALGIAIAPPRVARRLRRAVGLPELDGVLVRAVEADGPAARAGIQSGDLLTEIAGRPVDRVDVLYEALDGAAGTELALKVVRGTDEQILTVGL